MLTLTLAARGWASRVVLDGVDISRFLCAVAVQTQVDGSTIATLTYRGAVLVEMTGGALTLVEAPVHITCDQCGAQPRGAAAEWRTVPIAPPEQPPDPETPTG